MATFEYTVLNGEATITAMHYPDMDNVVVPDIIDGYPVVAIGNLMNSDCTARSVVLPEGLRSIGDASFGYNWYYLTDINIPSTVTSIGDLAFHAAGNTFGGCWKDRDTPLDLSNVTHIGSGAFSYCGALKSVILSENLTTISPYCFQATTFKSITIPDSVSIIDYLAFSQGDLTSINISPTSKLTMIGSQAFEYNELTSIYIPTTVTEIGALAFSNCRPLESITIPNNVTAIRNSTFNMCSALKTVTIGSGVESIAGESGYNGGAFSGCTALENMYFLGLTAPTAGAGWVTNTNLTVRGHAYEMSNFPPPFEVFSDGQVQGDSGILMGGNIYVYPVTADFSAFPLNGLYPLTVQFTDASTGTNISVWEWDFTNDGTHTSNLQNPIFTYSNSGRYTVKLYVTNLYANDTITKSNYIYVMEEPPIADFTSSTKRGARPLTIQFTDQTTVTPATSWLWDFTNEGLYTSNIQNPSFTYTDIGTYTVKLTVSNEWGISTITKTNYIIVGSLPATDFTATPIAFYAPLIVQFKDKTTFDPLLWEWDFTGDGTNISTIQNPMFIYTTPGIYTVKLKATNYYGPDTEIKLNYINIYRDPLTTTYEDEELQLLNKLKEHWDRTQVEYQTPGFYLYEDIKTHDISTSPYVVVYYVGENHTPYGLGYPANIKHTDMTIEFRTLTRPLLFKMKDHIDFIIDHIRNKPITDYDLIMNHGGRRIDAAPGTFAYALDVSLVKLVDSLDNTRWD